MDCRRYHECLTGFVTGKLQGLITVKQEPDLRLVVLADTSTSWVGKEQLATEKSQTASRCRS